MVFGALFIFVRRKLVQTVYKEKSQTVEKAPDARIIRSAQNAEAVMQLAFVAVALQLTTQMGFYRQSEIVWLLN